jgi:hypothetical protein
MTSRREDRRNVNLFPDAGNHLRGEERSKGKVTSLVLSQRAGTARAPNRRKFSIIDARSLRGDAGDE